VVITEDSRAVGATRTIFGGLVFSFGSCPELALKSMEPESDGAKGLAAIRAAGGITIVQDPESAEDPWMPRNAMCENPPDYCLPLNKIASLIVELDHGRLAR
jgi:hypothetical protein